MKKEDMIATMNERFSKMTEEGVQAMFGIIMAIPEHERWQLTTTPERLAELDAIKKQKEQEEAQKKAEKHQQYVQSVQQCIIDNEKLFDAIDSVKVPARYDLGCEDMLAIDYIHGHIGMVYGDDAIDAYRDFFKYGFLKGVRYATNKHKAEKKAS